MKINKYKKIAHEVIELEIQALRKLKKSINNSFDLAVNAIVKCQSKIILCGVGKSYLIASKIAKSSFNAKKTICRLSDSSYITEKKLIDEIETTYVIIPRYKSIRDKPISRTAYIAVVKSVCCGVTSGVLRQLYASKIAEYDKEYMQKQEEAAKVLGEEAPTLGPMLFAGMIIEGGIIGYDTNLLTGGRGARYLGIGMSRQYRQDQVTVSLRAVSVLTGEVLLNVQTKKTILSYGASGDVFRFIEQGTELVEFEDGTGKNESVTYAVRTAVEAAVLELVFQGHDRGLWKIEGRE